MSQIKVSVVMPILNVAGYLRECLDSMTAQTLKEMEIFCVDGGSADGTLEILREYAAMDSRIKILEDTKGSSGYANNFGISEASGEYVGIVEPDDYVEPDMFKVLYQTAVEQSADVVRADYKMFFGDGAKREFLDKRIAARGDQYGCVLCPGDRRELFKNDMSTWAGIYRRKFLLENRIRHNETPGAAYQDNGFWFQVFALAGRLYYLNDSFYRYRLDNPGSSIHNPGKLYAICDEYEYIRKRLLQEHIYEKYREVYVEMKFVRYISSYYRLSEELQPKFAARFHEEMAAHNRQGEIDRARFTPAQGELLEKIIDSAETFRGAAKRERDQLRGLLLRGQPIILFGCGSDGVRLLNDIKARGELEKICCICDNNPSLKGKTWLGKEILPLAEAMRRWRDACYVISSLNFADEIKGQLLKSGVKPDDIHVVNVC